MKKSLIWVIVVVMSVLFAALVAMQIHYYGQVLELHQQQFDVNVKRALAQTVRNIELQEARKIWNHFGTLNLPTASTTRNEKELVEMLVSSDQELSTYGVPSWMRSQSSEEILLDSLVHHEYQNRRRSYVRKSVAPPPPAPKADKNVTMLELLDCPIEERISRQQLEAELNRELANNGINVHDHHFHYQLLGLDGRKIFQCADFPTSDPRTIDYEQRVFVSDAPRRVGVIHLRFPDEATGTDELLSFLVPIFALIVLLIAVFAYTIYMVVRQKKLSAIKNDFIQNLTHEFKTPISALSLAAQMLGDKDVAKNEERVRYFTRVITSETKRFSMQVEKVLQMAMFDRNDISTFKFQETDAHIIIDDVVSNFLMKVESCGGTIRADYDAEDPIIDADPMHFTNLIYNILDNGLKYARNGVPPQLHLFTANDPEGRLVIIIRDNGIGISKSDQKHIFERFFRVSTGNVHNVKGVGIGLAYAASVVRAHKGTIEVESTLNVGTSFIIALPLLAP